MHICDLLDPRGIDLNATPTTKEQAINHLVDLITNTDCISDPDRFRNAVFDREAKGSTGLGEGVAIPHAKSAGVDHPGIAAMVVSKGVDFDSLDGKPTYLFFLIASPHKASDAHLDVLARLSTLLVDESFRNKLLSSKSVNEFLLHINRAENKEIKTEIADSNSNGKLPNENEQTYDIVAVTACPAGLSHTYMAAEALEKKARELGVSIKVETDGAAGNRNRLLPEDIANARGVIVASDRIIDMDRFIGKPMVRTGVIDGIRKPEALIKKALDPKCPLYQNGVLTSGSSFVMRLYRHLMSGLTYIMPIAATAGILSAIARLGFMQSTSIGLFFDKTGYSIGMLLFPILSAFIAFSIRGRTALVAGLTGGVMADMGHAGVIGAVVNGFVGGAVALVSTAMAQRFLKGHDAMVALLLYPILGALGTTVIAQFITNIPSQFIDAAIQNFINNAGSLTLVIIGAVLAGMMSADMGGPMNKIAYAAGVLMLADCIPENGPGTLVMAAVMAGGMVPPLAAGIAAITASRLFSANERKSALKAVVKGLMFITEGVLPYLAVSPKSMRFICILCSASAGAMSMWYRCGICAPHGGIFIFPLAENALQYLLTLVYSSLFGALLFIVFRIFIKIKSSKSV